MRFLCGIWTDEPSTHSAVFLAAGEGGEARGEGSSFCLILGDYCVEWPGPTGCPKLETQRVDNK